MAVAHARKRTDVSGESMDQIRLNVNGQDVALPGGFDLSKNLNSVIKSETGFKVCC